MIILNNLLVKIIKFRDIMEKPRNILLVVNPISGDSDKKIIVEKVKEALSEGTKLEIYRTSGKTDKKRIKEIIEELQPDRLLVAGGDGTVKMIAEALGEHKITIGIIPAGSANGLANDLELPMEMGRAIQVALGNKSREVDAIYLNNQLGLHISDFGLNAELIKHYEESNFRGKIGYAFNSISTLYNSNMPYKFQIKANGKTSMHRAIMVAIANSRKFGTGALVNPKGKIDDGKFEVLIFKKFDILEILKTLQGELEMSNDFVETIVTTKAVITTPFPIDFQIDGEYCDALKKVTAEIIPQRLWVAVS